MFWLYLIVAFLIFGISLYFMGRRGLDEDDVMGFGFAAFFGSLFWPLVLLIVIAFGPFVGFYMLGRRKFDREQAAKTKR